MKHAPSRPRRESMAERILARLRRGPATSLELESIARMSYRQRVSDLRRKGWKIKCAAHATRAGVNLYFL